jgi:hypothetical protein
MVQEASMDHEFIDENRVAEGFLKHTLSHSIRQAFVSHLLRCEECRDRVLLAEMFLNSQEASQPVPPVQIVQVPEEPSADSFDSETTLEMPAAQLPQLPPEPVDPSSETWAAEPYTLIPYSRLLQPRSEPAPLPPPSPASYVPRQRRSRRVETWQIVWLFVVAGALLLVVFAAMGLIYSLRHDQ